MIVKGFVRGTNKDDIREFEKSVRNDRTLYLDLQSKEEYGFYDIVVTESPELMVVNSRSVPINISHLQGTSRERLDWFMKILVERTPSLTVPSDLTVISTWTDSNLCLVYKQLGDRVVNAYDGRDLGEIGWTMPLKIDLIINALEKVETKYCLILDGYDVIINTFSDLIYKFEATGRRIFFNATRNNYPDTHVDKIHDRDWRGNYRYLNAGCVIGYTPDLLEYYKGCKELQETVDNPWESEQLIIRHQFAKTSELLPSPEAPVDFDWACDIFQTYINATVMNLDMTNEEEKWNLFAVI